MCGVTEAFMGIMAAVTAATTTMTIKNQNDMAEAQAEQANASAQSQYNALQEEERQINSQAALEKLERQRQALRERASLRVATGESGVAGVNPTRELANVGVQESYDMAILEENRQNKVYQNQSNKGAVQAEAKARNLDAMSKYTGALSSGLQIGASGAEGAVKGAQYGTKIEGWMKQRKTTTK